MEEVGERGFSLQGEVRRAAEEDLVSEEGELGTQSQDGGRREGVQRHQGAELDPQEEE